PPATMGSHRTPGPRPPRLPFRAGAARLTSRREKAVMAQAIVDPAEVRRFAQMLKKFNAELQHGMSVLHGQLVALGDTWRDQEHEKFREEFEETIRAVEKFLAASEVHIPFLLRKAERVEEYLQQR